MIRSALFLLAILLCDNAWSRRTHFVHLGREFVLVTPAQMTKNLPLVVILHGCRQDPAEFLKGTKFEAEAEKHRFIILAPEQPSFANYKQCWNWFLDVNQNRNVMNEMGQVVSAIDLVANKYQVNPNKIFVAGMSAGGAMAHNLAVCYPDVFSGAAVHSGINFKAAENVPEAETVLTSSRQKSPDYLGRRMAACARGTGPARLNKVLIIHGSTDQVVPQFHAELISDAQSVWRDYLDDGRANDSVRGLVTTETLFYPRGYSVNKISTQYPGFVEMKLLVKGLNHAWGGGLAVSQYFDPEAPSSNEFILDFFDL